MTQIGTAAASMLALVLSLVNLYLQRRDRRPRLRIRVRYEYRADALGGDTDRGTEPPRIHDDSQEGLYLRLGDFLREHGLDYPQSTPLVRFAISNQGERVVYLDSVRLVLHPRSLLFRDRLVLDPVEDKLLAYELAHGTADVLGQHGLSESPVPLVPGDGVGFKFGLVRLASALMREGHTGDVQLMLEVTDRLANVYRCPFSVSTDLWANSEEQ
jgi:hypothetical protein